MLDESQHGGAELGSRAVPRRGLGPRSMIASRGPSQRDAANIASRMHGNRPIGCTFLVPFDFIVLPGGLDPVEVLDGSQHGGAESGFSRATPRRGPRPRSRMAFRGALAT